MIKYFIPGIISCFILFGCTSRQTKDQQDSQSVREDTLTKQIISDTNNFQQPGQLTNQNTPSNQLIADTVIYDVIIHNTNSEDQWAQQCLQYVNQRMLIDSLFELVYEKKIVAYDYFENKPMNTSVILKIEKEPGFSRDNIGKIQFTERWYFDNSSLRFQKEVISIVLGYDLINSDGTIRGHKPVFKLNLNL